MNYMAQDQRHSSWYMALSGSFLEKKDDTEYAHADSFYSLSNNVAFSFEKTFCFCKRKTILETNHQKNMNYQRLLKQEYTESIFPITFALCIWFLVCYVHPTENIITATPKMVGIVIFGIFARTFLKYIKPNIFN